jgi:N6-adenosine-specific RNA methylase IME4
MAYPKQTDKFFFGLGRWTRGNTECCLLGVRGKPKRQRNDISQLIISPLSRHSEKPSIVREKIKLLMGDLPAIELFARQEIDGWDCWGNEISGEVIYNGTMETENE